MIRESEPETGRSTEVAGSNGKQELVELLKFFKGGITRFFKSENHVTGWQSPFPDLDPPEED